MKGEPPPLWLCVDRAISSLGFLCFCSHQCFPRASRNLVIERLVWLEGDGKRLFGSVLVCNTHFGRALESAGFLKCFVVRIDMGRPLQF